MPNNRQHDLTQTHGHMSDADRLKDCLCSSKERALLYARAALESTNPGVRELFQAFHGEETHMQEVTFSFLHTRGHYPTQMADESRIDEIRTRYQAMHDQMGLTDTPSMRRYQTAEKMHPAHVQDPEHFNLDSRRH